MRKYADILEAFQAFPAAGIERVLQGQRPLILAPHPDDESLGCGGLIAAACAAGLTPIVIILTDGAASHPDSKLFPPEKLRNTREQEAINATSLLGLPQPNLHFFRQPDSALPAQGETFETLVNRATALAEQQHCGLVIGPWAGDPHCDHEAAARIAASVAERRQCRLLSYPVWGWLRDPETTSREERTAGLRLDISAHLQRKSQAIAAHESQYGKLIPDSPKGFRLPENLLEIFARPFEVFIS